MAFQIALTSPNLVTLRGASTVAPAYAGSVYVSTCPNTNVYTARVNQASFTASFAQVTFDGGSGTLANVLPGMTVLISHTNDRAAAFFVGRVRKAPGASTLYINESSAAIADNDYIFVLDDYKIWDKLGREVSAVLKHDYEISFRQLPPVVYNLKSAYADWVNLVSNKYTIAFAPLAVAATSGATISTWAWNVADGTITVGSSSTQNITATFPQGFRWIYLTVTDSGSRTTTRKIPVFAHGSSYAPQLLTAGNLQVTANVASGVDATITAFAGVDTILDNTLLVAWSAEEIYQDATGSLAGDNIGFVGRIRKHTDTTRTDEQSSLDSERQYTVEGALTQLARIEQLPYEMLNKATPTLFGQITNMTLWRGIVYLLAECSTFLDLHSLYFDDTSNDYLAPTRNPVGNILNAINDLAMSINSALQMNYSGSAEVVLDLRMGTTAQRSAAVTVAPWDARDILDIQYEHAHVRTVGRLKSTGGSYNSVSNLYSTFESLAPGVAQDYPEGSGSLDRQVLKANVNGAIAQLELNTRAGHAFERAQEVDSLTITFPDGYHSILIPALNQWHTFAIDDDAINILLTTATRWLLTEVTISHNSADGTKDVRATFTRETSGNPGQTVTYPAVAEVPLLEPTFPPFSPYDMFPVDPVDFLGEDPVVVFTPVGNEIPTDGNALVAYTANVCKVVVNAMLTSTPGTRDVTPSDLLGTIRGGKFGAGKDFYLLSSDGVDSRVFYTEDIFAGSVVWTHGSDVSGEYSTLRVGSTQGEVYIETSGVGTTTLDFDFTVDDGGWVAESGGVPFIGTYSAGVGWIDTELAGVADPTNEYRGSTIEFALPGVTVTHFEATYTIVVGIFDVGGNNGITLDGSYVDTQPQPGTGSGTFTASYSVTTPGVNTAGIQIVCGFHNNNNTDPGGTVVITHASITYLTSVGLSTVYSTDFGQTFAAPESIGTLAGAFAGIDTARVGTAILAAEAGQIQKAISGGSYSAYGTTLPAGAVVGALVIPRYQFGSTTTANSGSVPHFLAFLSGLDGAGNSLYKVTASGATYTDITPTRSAVEGLAVSPNCVVMPWRSGAVIILIAEFGGSVRRLAVSSNSGGSYTFSGALDADTVALTMRKSDIAMKQVFVGNGPTLSICFNAFAGTPLLSDRNIGLTDNIIGIEVYG